MSDFKNICPLCLNNYDSEAKIIQGRKIYSCQNCLLLHVDPKEHLNKEEERKRYEYHQNSKDDPAYRMFLKKLCDPLVKILNPNSLGLDYGCGPGPTVSSIMKEEGFLVKDYDPFFCNDQSLLNTKYDFITCTEVFEHFHSPKYEIERLLNLLNDVGVLGVMTSLYSKEIDLANWYYLRDPTHVSFYQHAAMQWIADHYQLELILIDNNVILFKK